MMDGTYRYASMNNRGAMKNEPNLVLYNGEYDEEAEVSQWLSLGKKTKIYGRNLIKSHFFIKFLHKNLVLSKIFCNFALLFRKNSMYFGCLMRWPS